MSEDGDSKSPRAPPRRRSDDPDRDEWQPFIDGRRAYMRGSTVWANPYKPSDSLARHHAWLSGYMNAEMQFQNRGR